MDLCRGAHNILTIFPPASMFSTSTFPDSVDLTSVKGSASRARRRPRSIVAPRFGSVLAIAVQNRALLNVHTSNKVWIEITFGDSLKQYYGLPPWMSTA